MRTLVCSLILLAGCSGFAIGPTVEIRSIVVRAGVPIEVMENETVDARVMKEDGPTDIFQQDIGGWITMPPDHWETFKKEYERLKKKAGEN